MALAAGLGTRLAPITQHTPKPLLPVGGMALLDHALERLTAVSSDLAVNAHHHAEQVVAHVGDRAQVSVEEELMGTAGALGRLREWIGGRPVALTNGDAWLWPNPLPWMLEGWSGRTVRLSAVSAPDRADFDGGLRYSGCCLLPREVAEALPAEPAGLFETCWGPRLGSDALEIVEHPGRFFDCGTPVELAAARHSASAGLGPGA